MKYEDSQLYRLGKLYKELGELLMNPRTDMRDLAAASTHFGGWIKVEFVPAENSPMTGDVETPNVNLNARSVRPVAVEAPVGSGKD